MAHPKIWRPSPEATRRRPPIRTAPVGLEASTPPCLRGGWEGTCATPHAAVLEDLLGLGDIRKKMKAVIHSWAAKVASQDKDREESREARDLMMDRMRTRMNQFRMTMEGKPADRNAVEEEQDIQIVFSERPVCEGEQSGAMPGNNLSTNKGEQEICFVVGNSPGANMFCCEEEANQQNSVEGVLGVNMEWQEMGVREKKIGSVHVNSCGTSVENVEEVQQPGIGSSI